MSKRKKCVRCLSHDGQAREGFSRRGWPVEQPPAIAWRGWGTNLEDQRARPMSAPSESCARKTLLRVLQYPPGMAILSLYSGVVNGARPAYRRGEDQRAQQRRGALRVGWRGYRTIGLPLRHGNCGPAHRSCQWQKRYNQTHYAKEPLYGHGLGYVRQLGLCSGVSYFRRRRRWTSATPNAPVAPAGCEPPPITPPIPGSREALREKVGQDNPHGDGQQGVETLRDRLLPFP